MSSQISFDSIALKQVTEVKFPGVYIDEGLRWKSHISCICKKISKSVGIMYRFRFFLSSNTKISLYYSLIYPYLTYCTTVWSSTYVTNLNRISLLQKRAVWAMTNSNHRAPSAPLFIVIHSYDTRASAHFRPHTCRTNIKQFTTLFRGPKMWNALPLSITSSPSLSTLKESFLIS